MIKTTLTQVGGAILLFLFILKLIEDRPLKFFKENLVIVLPILLFLLSGLVSFLNTSFYYASKHEFIRRVVYITVALVVIYEFNTYEKIRRLLRWVFFAAFVSTAYGIIQYLDMTILPGLDPFIWRAAFGARVFSTFGNPNFYGDFLVIMGPITLAQFLRTKNLFYLFLFGMITFNVVYTYSKGAWVGYTAGFFAFCILLTCFFSKFRTRFMRKIIIGGLLIAMIVCIIAVIKFSLERTDSIKFRVYTWVSCWEMINTKPILGTGIGTFYVTYPAWRRPQIFFIEGKHNTETDHPENEYLEVWFDEGIIGIGIFLWIIIVFGYFGLKTLKMHSGIQISKGKSVFITEDERAYLLLGLLSGFTGMLAHNFVCVSLRFVSSGTYLWLLVGLIGTLIANKTIYSSSHNPVKLKDIHGVILCVIFWAIMFYIWTVGTHIILPYFATILIVGCLLETKLVNENETNILHIATKSLSNLNLLRCVIYAVLFVILVLLIRMFNGFFYGDIHHNIAIFYSKRAEWHQALANYTLVHKYNPGFIMAHYFTGNVYNDRFTLDLTHYPEWGDRIIPEEKIDEFRKKYKLDIDLGNRDFRYDPDLKAYKEYRNDAQRSLDAYDRTNKLAPNYVQSHHQRGLLYLKLGDAARDRGENEKALYYYNQSLHYFEKYRMIDPIFPLNYYRAALVYTRLGDIENARKMYEAHLETPNMFTKFVEHSILVEDWGRRRYGDYAETCFQYGNLMFINNNFSEAEKFYKKSLEFRPNDTQTLKNLAMLYQRVGEREKIQEVAQQLLTIAPHDREVQQAFSIIKKGVEQ